MKYLRVKTADETPVVQIQHGYDRGGNRLYRKDLVAEVHSELYQYDQMNQLTAMQRGVLNAVGDTVTSKSFEEDFTFDTTGNWLSYKQDANGDGAFEVNQTRTHNTANEIQTISGGNTLVSHDRNGCMTKVPKPLDNTTAYTLVYDAWNRLAQVKNDTSVVATYVYDARNHRIKKTVGTVVTLSYFNQHWQEIESIAAGVTATNVYGLRYIDDVVCRVKNTEVLYALQDTNWNVVALVTPFGVVAERITYDSFGKPTFRNANFTAKTASSYGWSKTFTGQTYDPETGLMLYRNRYYHTGLGRFITRDPIGYRGEDFNLYRYVFNRPILLIDPAGKKKKGSHGEMGIIEIYPMPVGTFGINKATCDLPNERQQFWRGPAPNSIGYDVKYKSPVGVCQGRGQVISMVQAVSNNSAWNWVGLGLTPHFDSDTEDCNKGKLYPEYMGQKKPGSRYSLRDAPWDTQKINKSLDTTWTMIVCAVCTTTLEKRVERHRMTLVQMQVLGCVSLTYGDSTGNLTCNGSSVINSTVISAVVPDGNWEEVKHNREEELAPK